MYASPKSRSTWRPRVSRKRCGSSNQKRGCSRVHDRDRLDLDEVVGLGERRDPHQGLAGGSTSEKKALRDSRITGTSSGFMFTTYMFVFTTSFGPAPVAISAILRFGENLADLGLELSLSNQRAGGVERDPAGDVDRPSAGPRDNMGVSARSCNSPRIDVIDLQGRGAGLGLGGG